MTSNEKLESVIATLTILKSRLIEPFYSETTTCIAWLKEVVAERTAEEQLVHFLLFALEVDDDWNADTLDAIAQKAVELDLATTNPNGMFKRKGEK